MRIAWWWNNDYEELMGNVTGFLEKHPNIVIQNVNFGMKPDGSRFYYQIIYKQ